MSVIVLPLHLVSIANRREHWGKRAARAKTHREAAIAVPSHPLPCVVTITRIAPRQLDTDNLAISAKNIRDGIADKLGVPDNDPRVTWKYAQEKGKTREYAVRVTLESE